MIKELQSSTSQEELNNSLLNVVGYENIDLVSDIVKYKSRIVTDAIRRSGAFATTES